MEYNTYETDMRMQQLYAAHRSGKTKLTLGIVFLAVGFSFMMFLIAMIAGSKGIGGAWLMLIIYMIILPSIGVGIPFLIIGIIRTSNANRRIALLRGEISRAQGQPVGQPPVYQQPMPQASIYADPAPQQPAENVASDPAPQQPAENVASDPAAEQPAAEQPAAEQPAAKQPAAEQPAGE